MTGREVDTLTGIVFDIRRYSIHDGPGIRTAVFLKGCPLDCAWCHNPESQSGWPELLLRPARCIACGACLEACQPEAIDERYGVKRESCIQCGKCVPVCPAEAREMAGREMTVAQVLEEIERDRVFYEGSTGGVTFTGGEPLAQPRFLAALLSACRTRGLHTALDTSGHAPWTVINNVRTLVDLFLYDLKLMDDSRHREWTGVSNGDILENLRRLSVAGHSLRVRIPVIPGINDDEGNLRASGEFVASLPVVPTVELLPYHNIAEAKYAGLGRKFELNLNSPQAEHMGHCAALLGEYGIRVLA